LSLYSHTTFTMLRTSWSDMTVPVCSMGVETDI
jgi:hypothetical protein